MAGASPAMTEKDMEISAYPVCFLLAKRSNPGFRRRSGADFVAYCPPAAGDAETVITRPVLRTRRRAISWRRGLLRFANKKRTVIPLIFLYKLGTGKEK